MSNNNRSEESEAVYTTIVGGRPPGCGTKIGQIPRGIEVLVKKASVDAEFKKLLLRQRAAAAVDIGMELSLSEVAMLSVIPAGQLEKIIVSAKVSPSQRSAFMGRAAVLMLAALGASAIQGCGPATEGIRPDVPPANSQAVEAEPLLDDTADQPMIKGIRPDVPPETSRGIRPDPPGSK
jgi:hypothetical protein